jgi:hypothetical protein
MHEIGALGEALSQGVTHVIPARLDINGVHLVEHRAPSGRDHALMRLWHPLQALAKLIPDAGTQGAREEHRVADGGL